MKPALRALLFILLAGPCTAANAQRHVLYSPLPRGTERPQALEAARQVLLARGWEATLTDRQTIEARKGLSGIRISMWDNSLLYDDLTDRPQMRQRNRAEGPKRAAVPQAEIDALRADFGAAFAGKLPAVAAARVAGPGHVLLGGIAPSADPASVLGVARHAFAARRWQVTSDSENSFIARIRSGDTDSTLLVFLADGALRYTEGTVNRRGEKAEVPDRWIANVRKEIGRALAADGTREAPQPAAREPAPRAAQAGDAAERLRKLKSALDAGLITQAEYDAKRAEILGGL